MAHLFTCCIQVYSDVYCKLGQQRHLVNERTTTGTPSELMSAF